MNPTRHLLLAAGLALCAGTAAAENLPNHPAADAAVYGQHCARCHNPGWTNRLQRAPRAGSTFWAERMESPGLETLVQRTRRGHGRMAAQPVSDAEARAALRHLLATVEPE